MNILRRSIALLVVLCLVTETLPVSVAAQTPIIAQTLSCCLVLQEQAITPPVASIPSHSVVPRRSTTILWILAAAALAVSVPHGHGGWIEWAIGVGMGVGALMAENHRDREVVERVGIAIRSLWHGGKLLNATEQVSIAIRALEVVPMENREFFSQRPDVGDLLWSWSNRLQIRSIFLVHFIDECRELSLTNKLTPSKARQYLKQLKASRMIIANMADEIPGLQADGLSSTQFTIAAKALSTTLDILDSRIALASGQSLLENQDLRELVSEIVALTQEELGTIHFEVHMDLPDNAVVLGNRYSLKSAIRNLLTNAAEAALKRGSSLQVKIMVGQEDGRYFVRVKDNGSGIPADLRKLPLGIEEDSMFYRPLCTELNRTTHKKGERGMGLTETWDALFDMGARLSIESKTAAEARPLEETGTTMSIHFTNPSTETPMRVNELPGLHHALRLIALTILSGRMVLWGKDAGPSGIAAGHIPATIMSFIAHTYDPLGSIIFTFLALALTGMTWVLSSGRFNRDPLPKLSSEPLPAASSWTVARVNDLRLAIRITSHQMLPPLQHIHNHAGSLLISHPEDRSALLWLQGMISRLSDSMETIHGLAKDGIGVEDGWPYLSPTSAPYIGPKLKEELKAFDALAKGVSNAFDIWRHDHESAYTGRDALRLSIMQQYFQGVRQLSERVETDESYDYRGQPREIDLNAFFKEETDVLQGSPDYNIRFSPEEATMRSLIDPNKLTEIMINLMRNAAKAYGQPHAPITITTRVQRIKIPGKWAYEKFASVEFEDESGGIPEKVQDTLMDLGTSTSGSGIGLYVARRVMVEAGGKIDWVTRPGEGSTFFLRLPLRQDPTVTKWDLLKECLLDWYCLVPDTLLEIRGHYGRPIPLLKRAFVACA